MAIFKFDSGHNDTTERFKRQSSVFFSDQFLGKPLTKTLWQRKATVWLVVYLTALVLFVWLFPMQPVKATAPPPVKHAQLLPNFQQHLSAFKACAVGSLPVWINKTTIQCLKEMP